MSLHILQTIEASKQALEQGTRLILFVSTDVTWLEQFGQMLVSKLGIDSLPIGPALSARLLEQNMVITPRLLRDELHHLVKTSTTPLLCTEIDLLFYPSFQLDPLRLFNRLSLLRPLLVLWPGEIQNNVLTYARPAHAHYRGWSTSGISDICIFSI